jgi:hypothetical protein
LILTIGISVHP